MINERIQTKFLIVGIWNTIFGLGVFFFFDFVFMQIFQYRSSAYILATLLATPIGITQAFFAHKIFTFNSSSERNTLIKEYIKFVSVYLLMYLFNIIMMPILVEIINIHPWISAIIITLTKAVFTYLSHLHYTFTNNV